MEIKKTIAIIPARGRSKGILHKNIIKLKGKPLISYTIEASVDSKIFDKVIVSTDDAKIAQVAGRYKEISIIKRPKRLATSKASIESAMIHVIDYFRKSGYIPDIICLLQPTSPLRDAEDIKKAFQKFCISKADSLLSVSPHCAFIWREKKKDFIQPINYDYLHRPRRQDRKNEFKENGAIYFVKRNIFEKNKNRLGGRIIYYVMSEAKSIEIDTLFDLKIAEMLLREKEK